MDRLQSLHSVGFLPEWLSDLAGLHAVGVEQRLCEAYVRIVRDDQDRLATLPDFSESRAQLVMFLVDCLLFLSFCLVCCVLSALSPFDIADTHTLAHIHLTAN